MAPHFFCKQRADKGKMVIAVFISIRYIINKIIHPTGEWISRAKAWMQIFCRNAPEIVLCR